jgi:prepilin-type N-terminal cleavage/methylation domain-containing protein
MSSYQQQSGFTLVEMIVSLTLFSVVITITVGALLSLIGSNDQLRTEQSVMTNLAFALDSMSREIRTGTYFFCSTGTNFNNQDLTIGARTTQDCTATSTGLSFVEGGRSITASTGSTRIAYYFDSSNHAIMRRVGNQAPQSMTSEGIYIANLEFTVTGTDTLEASTNTEQPTVTIFIDARDSATGIPNYVQTTVTQRALDL